MRDFCDLDMVFTLKQMPMIPNRMFPNESLISAPENNHLVLTTHRLRSLNMGLFRKDFESIFLEDIASIAVKVWMNWVLFGMVVVVGWTIALGFVSGGIQHRQDEMIWMGLAIMAGSLVLGFLVSRKTMVCVASKGGDAIWLPLKMTDIAQVFTFIESVEVAKAARVLALSGRP